MKMSASPKPSRRALGDDPDVPRFLETVVGKGYRFVGALTIVPASSPQTPRFRPRRPPIQTQQ